MSCRYYRIPVICTFIMATAGIGMCSGQPAYLDSLALESKYIVIATCIDKDSQSGLSAKLKVEKVIKAPTSDSVPKELIVKGVGSTADRFNFIKGKRCFVFIDSNFMATQQGSSTFIDANDKLISPLELISLKPETNTVKELTRQIRYILSGEYEKDLHKAIANSENPPSVRMEKALALVRINPSQAVEPLAKLIYDLSFIDINDGSCHDICRKLVLIAPKQAVDVWLKISRMPKPRYSIFYDLTYLLGEENVRFEDFAKQVPLLLKTLENWQQCDKSETPVAYMLSIFGNNDCHCEEVKQILISVLSKDKIEYVYRIMNAASRLNFPQTVPLYWKQLKELERTGYEYGNNIPHPLISGIGVLVDQTIPKDVATCRKTLFIEFPELNGKLSGQTVTMGSGVYFLTIPDKEAHQSIYFVGQFHGNTNKPRDQWTVTQKAIRLIGSSK